jgi:hypothetical protein
MPRFAVRCCVFALVFALPLQLVHAADRPLPLANETLLHSARAWEALARGDLARLALTKLVAARPDSPEALLELGELELRLADFAGARATRDALAARFSRAPAAASFALEYRMATTDRVAFAAAARLVQTGRGAAGRAALLRLFPHGAPRDALGIEYYRLWAATPNGWTSAREGLARLAAAHAGDARYTLAWAALSLQRPAFAGEAVAALCKLVGRDDVRGAEVDRLLAAGLRELGDARAPRDVLRDYLRRHPEDSSIRALQARQLLADQEREFLAGRAWATVIPALQAGLARELARGGSSDAHAAAAARWLSLSRSSCMPRCAARAASELRAAWALHRRHDDDLIAIAETLAAQGLLEESGNLLALGTQLAPRSRWLFAAYAHWLIDHAPATQAVAWLQGLTPPPSWPRAEREELLATALELRAASEAAAGDTATAIDDLRLAIDARPHDPWLRARLADLYAATGSIDAGRTILSAGVAAWPGDPVMHFALALYLERHGAFDDAYAAIDAVDSDRRTADMRALYDRMRVKRATDAARRLHAQGDDTAAMAALTAVDAAAAENLDLAAEIAYAWIAIGQPERGIALVAPYHAADASVRVELLWAQVLDSAEDSERLRAALMRLEAEPASTAEIRGEIERMARDLELRDVRALVRDHHYAAAARRLDALLRADGKDRAVRAARAELYLAVGKPDAACDIYASLVAEQPEDLAARLAYVRALTAAGRFAVARALLLELPDPMSPDLAAAARLARAELEARTQPTVSAGLLAREQPGSSGMSQLDLVVVPSEWRLPLDSGPEINVRADAITVDAGRLPGSYSDAALLGTIAAAGPGARERATVGAETGVALGLGYRSGVLRADLGTTPLGFVASNMVGGVEWRPRWADAEWTLGVARRAVTNSELSYAGLRDPVTGEVWGAVLATGAYGEFQLNRNAYALSGSLQAAELTGTHVENNQFVGARVAASREVLSLPSVRGTFGAAMTYWNYAHNLSNYTYGSGGYYSPQNYVSFALPLDLQGFARGWSYRARAAVSYSIADLQSAAFYPEDANLESEADHGTLPAGYASANFGASHNNALGFSVYAAAERALGRALVVGGLIDINRTDYYHPTTVLIYVRHGFGAGPTAVERPPLPALPYIR